MSPLFSPVSAGGIGKATVTATTGSPTVDTSTRAGKTIYKFTGSGSITVGTAGTAEILVCGGGGGGGLSGGGAGGYIYDTAAILPSGTLTVLIGTGGTATATGPDYFALPGTASRLGNFVAPGGGRGGNNLTARQDGSPGGSGGSGGGGYGNGYAGGVGVSGLGNNGGTGPTGTSGSGGGAGSAASGLTPGAGAANSITGTSVTYCAGGNSQTTTATVNNTGNGANSGSNTGATGYVVVVVG